MNESTLRNQFPRLTNSRRRQATAYWRSFTNQLGASGAVAWQRALVAVCLLLGLTMTSYAQTPRVNLKLEKTISNASPALGDVITYTVAVTNTGSATATSVVVSESMTAGLSEYLSSTASTGSFAFNQTSYTGTWTVGTVQPGETVRLLLTARVTGEGVAFNSAEVASMDGTDANSTPGNGSLSEDDYDNACFSVPLTWYVGDEYTVDKPAGFSAVTWLVNGNPISATTAEASVDASGNLLIRAPGIFSFSGQLNGCDVSNCCNIIVSPGATASLGDYVFEDRNADGIQNAGDVPIPGVVVTLYQNGSAVATTTTGATGLYSFTGLTPGNSLSYSVGFTTPAGFTATAPRSGTDRSVDSDPDIATGRSLAVTLTAGESNTTVDAGYIRSASIGDYVFNDANKDGVQDAGDTPLAGVVVTLYQNGSAIATTTTGATGLYSFTGLTPGSSLSYSVGFTPPGGFTATTPRSGTDTALDSDADPVTGRSASFTLGSGQSNTTVDAGYYQLTAGLGDYVFEDRNVNGVQDAGDVPIAGVVVTLYQNGSAVSTTTTSTTGYYSFTGLAINTPYVVGFTAPQGFTATLANAGPNDGLDSDVLATGLTGAYSLSANEFNSTIDAGYIRPAVLSAYAFNDANRNGVQDAGDTPLAGVTVTLYQNGSAVATATTGATGFYSFTGLTPGSSLSYSVGFSRPPNFESSPAKVGGNDATDSDADPVTGLTASVTLSSGQSSTTIAGGFFPSVAGLGDYVFEDRNANGVQDAGDVPIAGVVVTLYQNGSAVSTTTTTTSGFYSFTGLAVGPQNGYQVGFATPTGFAATTANVGTNRAIDSDMLTTGLTGTFSLSANEFNSTVDAGFIRPASIGDYVFNDVNRNGIQDAGDTPLAGVTVTLYQNGQPIKTEITGATGSYSFTGLTPGSSYSYTVGFSNLAGFMPTTPRSGTNTALDSDVDPLTGRSASFTLSSGENNTTVDAGFVTGFGAIGDFVWFDYNNDGQQGPVAEEPGVAGLTVQLFSASNTTVPLATTVTDAQGNYLFGNLPSGQYIVKFQAPTGSVFTTKNRTGVSSALDSNAGLTDGLTDVITIDVTQPLSSTARVNLTIDAGVVPYGSIGDYVWRDLNGDGIQNDGNTGVEGIQVELYSSANLTTPLAQTVTDGTGKYLFSNLISGDYRVKFTLPASETFTAAEQGTNRTLDSDAGADGFSRVVTINTRLPLGNVGRNNLTIDAGIRNRCAASPLVLVAGTTNLSLCVGGSTSVSAVATGATRVNWYLDATAQVLSFTTASGQLAEVSPTTNITYYVQAISADGCVSGIQPVVITVNARPGTPSCLKEATICNNATFNLATVQLNNVPLPGSTLEWRTGISETSPLVTNLSAVGPGTYYLFERSRYGCYSYPAVLTVNAIDCSCTNVATVSTSLTSGSVCEGDRITLVASIGGSATGVTWMPASAAVTGALTSANSLTATYVPTAADIAAGQVSFSVMTNDPDGSGVCTPARSTVVVVINKRPDAPIGVACETTLLCRGDATKLFGFTTGAQIRWYANGTPIGTTTSGSSLTIAPQVSTTYTAEAISAAGCVSLPSTPIAVTVNPACLADLAVTKTVMTAGPYKVGDVISYGITVSNNGPVNATDVTVTERLPASLAFVGVTGTGYNASTGTWTVGNLTNGADRSLIVQARITSAGSIVNNVTVSGGNDDPTKLANNTATATVTIEQCATPAPTIACAVTAICQSTPAESTTLVALNCAGTVRWSNGMTGSSITVFPTVTTTYTASCVEGACTSGPSNAITVTVTSVNPPVIVASADRVCPGGVVSLTATGCEGGRVYWSDGMTGSVISLTVSSETTISAQCFTNSCYSRSTTKVIGIGSSLPKPTVVCSTTAACPGEAVVLTVQGCTGTPLWSTGERTTSITVRPTAGNNSYSVQCTNGTCTSPRSDDYTIQLVPAAVPTVVASTTSACAGSVVSLTATGCDGLVSWSNNRTGSVISVTLTSTESFYAYCKVRECTSTPSAAVTVQVGKPSAPIIAATPTGAVCAGESVTLTALSGCTNGTVRWSNGLTGRSVVVTPLVNTDYTATCVTDNCESAPSGIVKVLVRTTAGTAPTIAASAPSVCNGGSVTLTAGGCTNGTVTWSNGMTGNRIVVTPTVGANTFSANCREADKCGTPQSQPITINVTTPPAPTIVCSTSVICPGESVDLTVQNCMGTPTWSTGETGRTTISVSPTSTTSYSVKCSDGTCTSAPSQLYTITVVPVPTPTIVASNTAISEGESVTLSVGNCPGTVTWSNNQTGNSIVVTPTAAVSYYTAVCRFRSCSSDVSATVTIRKAIDDACAVKAGTLVATVSDVCASTMTTVTLSAANNTGWTPPTGYSVRYVLTKGANLVIQQTSTVPSFTVAANASDIYTIHTLVYNANTLSLATIVPGTTTGSDLLNLIRTNRICADLDVTGARTKVSYVPAPTILGARTQQRCYGDVVSVTATGCETGRIVWSNGAIGSTQIFTLMNDVQLTAVCDVTGCTSAPSVPTDISLAKPTVPTIGSDKLVVCAGDPATLTAQGCTNGTYLWSTGATTDRITVTPQTSMTYAVKCTVGQCQSAWSPVVSLTVGQPATPTVTINNQTDNVTTCFGAPVTLTARGCAAGSFVIWSNNQVGNSITVNPAVTATYSAQCCTSNNCKGARSNEIVIAVLPKVGQPRVTDLTNACPLQTVNLASAVGSVQTTGNTYEYYTSATMAPGTRLTNTNVTASGTYYVVERTAGGCASPAAPIQVNITNCGGQLPCNDNPVTADAGTDATICAAKTYKLAGRATGNNLIAQWTTSGTGTFDNAFAAQPIYSASEEDVRTGQVTLTLMVKTNNAACGTATDAMVLTLNGPKERPVVSVIGATQLCYGDSVTLQASAPAGYTYLWTGPMSNKPTTQQIRVKQGGTYSVQIVDQAGCSSVPSAGVTINVAAPVLPPVVANLRNTCPATTVSLSAALGTLTPGSTYEYRMGESASSALVMNPNAVGEGTYYVFERNASQCVSLPARVAVRVIDCAQNRQPADVAIAKSVSTTAVRVGEAVTYKLRVTNNGPGKAYNVDVRDVLPAGLNLVIPAAPTTYTVSNGTITKRFDSLAVGASDSVVFMARLTRKGEVRNTASITYGDVADPVAANNTSGVSISDNSPFRAGTIGLAKEVIGTPTFTNDSTLAVAYRFTVTNYGDEDLTAVMVTDNLESVFGTGRVRSAQLRTETGNLTMSPIYTGTGTTTQLLGSSTLTAGQTATFSLNATIRLSKADTATRTFTNAATATAMNATTMVSDASVAGADADPDKDGNPTNNTGGTSFTIQGTPKPQQKQIGVAMEVANVAKLPDNSYNVTYKVYVKNYSQVALTNVSLHDTLSKAFTSPTAYSMVRGLTANANSQLVVNGGFDGRSAVYYLNSGLSRLAAGREDTLTYTINVLPNGFNGPFYTQVTAMARPEGSTLVVTDKSNPGSVIVPADDMKTALRFDLPTALLGLAKDVGTPVRVGTNLWDVPYTIKVCNLGETELSNVQVLDNLAETFGQGAQVTSVTVTADMDLKVNPNYRGVGFLTNLLDASASRLPVRAIRYVQVMARVDVSKAQSLSFTNYAYGSAMSGSVAVSDTSTAGTNVDPDNDLDPRNNSVGTPVTLNSLPGAPHIGVAMMVRDTARQANGSYNVTYQLVVKHYGSATLHHVALTDTLAKVFTPQLGASFRVLSAPTASAGSKLRLNPGFNGDSDPMIVIGDTTSSLAIGATDTLLVRVNVMSNGQTGTFFNTAYGVARAGTEVVRDASTNGLNPDVNGNGNPTDFNESEATPLNLPTNMEAIFIPEGFSPNGDGVNDLFVIRGTQGLTVNLEVYNRWGHRVYGNADYRNDWDGKPNTGAQVGNTSNGLPDGTYYYVVKLSDGREFVRYMTISR